MTEFNDALPPGGHGGVNSQPAQFSRLIDTDDFVPLYLGTPDTSFGMIAAIMDQGSDNPNDDPDPQENPRVPAGYTYFGQLIDHDLTFDTSSSLDTRPQTPNNERTPRLDLDCLYGPGFASAPYMYDTATGKLLTNPNGFDLPRAGNDRAIIGDPRNDENSIVCQIQLGLIHFHNNIVDHMIAHGIAPGADAFAAARTEVRRTYQAVVIHDYLRRVIDQTVVDSFLDERMRRGRHAFRLFTEDKWNALPLEFTAAAYRYGHSMIRNAYRLNTMHDSQRIFDGHDDPDLSLVGFGSLDPRHKIDWHLLLPTPDLPQLPGDTYPNETHGAARLQFAYKMDTSVVRPIMALPPRIVGPNPLSPFAALAARNLKRAYNFQIPSGQDIACALEIDPLDPDHIFLRNTNGFEKIADNSFKTADGDSFSLDPRDAKAIAEKTPLWLYVLMEAQSTIPPGFDEDTLATVTTALGPVGGRILLEVFYGILLNDPESALNAANWRPVIRADGDATKLRLWDILHFAGVV